MYSVNGIPLHDPVRDWAVTSETEWVAGASVSRPSLTIPGMDGSIPMPGSADTPALAIAIDAPRSTLDDLRALLQGPRLYLSREGTPGTVYAELVSLTPVKESIDPDPAFTVKAVFRLPGVWFRGDVETFTAALTSASKEAAVFPGLSGKVNDAIVRFTDCTAPKVQDSAGSFMAWSGTVGPGEWVRFHAASGRAWLTTADEWVGGMEIDPLAISYGMGPGFFSITPSFTDPTTRAGKLAVATGARGAAAAIDVRGRNAYLV